MEPFCVPESAPDPVPVECGDSVELEEAEGDSGKKKGRRWKRLRAHINPLSSIKFYYPKNRSEQWTLNFFPSYFSSEFYRNLSGNQSAPEKKFDHQVRVADVGCGFGGLLEALAPVLPRNLILGMEIREPVVRSVEKRIARLQEKQVPNLQAECPPPYSNIGVVNTNTMKYIVRFFDKGQLLKIFFCFPDPHFKKDNHRRRIISRWLLDEYAYCLAPGGKLYCITDVADLFEWMTSHCENHPLFKRIDNESDEVKNDPCIACMYATDESKKVSRINGSKFHAVFVRISEKN